MAEPRQLEKLTRDDVAKHNKAGDLVRASLFSWLPIQIDPNFTSPHFSGSSLIVRFTTLLGSRTFTPEALPFSLMTTSVR